MARKKFSVGEIFKDEGREVGTSEGKKVGLTEGKKVGKDKKSFSIERNVLNDLEVLAWYMDRSSSQVVEEAIRNYVASNKETLEKAREVRETR